VTLDGVDALTTARAADCGFIVVVASFNVGVRFLPTEVAAKIYPHPSVSALTDWA
jgi:hypothetical protein